MGIDHRFSPAWRARRFRLVASRSCAIRIPSIEKMCLSHFLELVTVLRSNLRDVITPDLVLQFNALKAHINIKSFHLID